MNELADNYWCIGSRNPTRILPKINYGFNKLHGKQSTLSFQCEVSVQEELLWLKKIESLNIWEFWCNKLLQVSIPKFIS